MEENQPLKEGVFFGINPKQPRTTQKKILIFSLFFKKSLRVKDKSFIFTSD